MPDIMNLPCGWNITASVNPDTGRLHVWIENDDGSGIRMLYEASPERETTYDFIFTTKEIDGMPYGHEDTGGRSC
jgi:hypothetical protein